jgi:hypothetical protein
VKLIHQKGRNEYYRRERDGCRNKVLQETRVESEAQVGDFASHTKRHNPSLKYEKRQNP